MDSAPAYSLPDDDACYAAVKARDTRFDGRFFTGVKTTGIYCRPICPARLPKRANCTFFPSAAAAESEGFRACLRCRPEAAPGTPAAQGSAATVTRALRLIGEGALDTGSVSDLADRLGLSDRHVRRLFVTHLGANPENVAATRRLLLANQLLRDTALPISEIAYAAGFASLRRFNDAFAKRYGESPSNVRKRLEKDMPDAAKARPAALPFDFKLRLGYRPPFDWQMILSYLQARLIPGVETIAGNHYRRSIRHEDGDAFIEAEPDATRNILWVRVISDRPFQLADLVARMRRVFDLDADPAAISQHFQADPLIGPLARTKPGLRIPGAYDGFELAVRAILGQQVSVKGATTLAGRLVSTYGTPVDRSPGPDWPTHLFPAPGALTDDRLHEIGLPKARAATLRNLSEAVATGEMRLDPGSDATETLSRFKQIKGIGAWTASYVALRALGDPDAFPHGDLGLQKAAAPGESKLTAQELAARAEAWHPWRGYAALHLWSGHS